MSCESHNPCREVGASGRVGGAGSSGEQGCKVEETERVRARGSLAAEARGGLLFSVMAQTNQVIVQREFGCCQGRLKPSAHLSSQRETCDCGSRHQSGAGGRRKKKRFQKANNVLAFRAALTNLTGMFL